MSVTKSIGTSNLLMSAAVLDENGMTKPIYIRPSDGAYFVVGNPDEPFGLRLSFSRYSTAASRLQVTVDGINPLTNSPCSAGDMQGARIIKDGGIIETEHVFGQSAYNGQPGPNPNAGVIGMAMYRPPLPRVEMDDLYAGTPAEDNFRPQYSPITRSRLRGLEGQLPPKPLVDRGSLEVLVIRYGTADALQREGIRMTPEPQAFQSSTDILWEGKHPFKQDPWIRPTPPVS